MTLLFGMNTIQTFVSQTSLRSTAAGTIAVLYAIRATESSTWEALVWMVGALAMSLVCPGKQAKEETNDAPAY